tara:strand:- start:1620 stop:1856 length:237 start_codon:yes stop_codon:yes gene_type:complete
MRFTVRIAEVHYSYRDVEADTWREAVKKAQDGDFDNEYVEYSHTPDLPIDITDSNQDNFDNDTDDFNNEPDSEKDKKR